MKILALVVTLSYISFCSAAANRSTVWVIGDELIYSSIKGYQACSTRLASTSNTTLLSTTYFRISTGASADSLVWEAYAAPGTAGDNYGLNTLQLIFIYGDSATPNLFFNLPAFTVMTLASGAGLTNSIPQGTYFSASGSTWLTVRTVSNLNYPAAATDVNSVSHSYVSVLITDYRSGSTIAVTQYQDGGETTTNKYNHLYSVMVRTPTSYLTNSADPLVGGCSASRPSSPVYIQPSTSLTCSVSSSVDSSLSGATTACANTDTHLPGAVAAAIPALNNLRSLDNALFGAAGSKFSIAVNFGVLIAISSIIFSFFH